MPQTRLNPVPQTQAPIYAADYPSVSAPPGWRGPSAIHAGAVDQEHLKSLIPRYQQILKRQSAEDLAVCWEC